MDGQWIGEILLKESHPLSISGRKRRWKAFLLMLKHVLWRIKGSRIPHCNTKVVYLMVHGRWSISTTDFNSRKTKLCSGHESLFRALRLSM